MNVQGSPVPETQGNGFKPWQIWILGILTGLAAAGLVLLLAGQPRGVPIQLPPTPSPSPLIVSVSGAVQNPGVYTLSSASRVQDAIQAAGGLTENALSDQINLAALLKDGVQVWVPSSDQTSPPDGNSSSRFVSPQNRININTATEDDLCALPGIGPSKAAQIVAYRTEHGTFDTTADILLVSGIGPSLYEQIQPYITTGNPE